METNLYTVTVTPMINMLENLSGILEKASSFAKSKQLEWHPEGMQESSLLNSHILFDQFPFIRQVQIACDNAKNGVSRLSGIEAPKHEDTEKTFSELKARIEKTVDFLKTIKPETVIGQEERKITLQFFPGKYLSGLDYATLYLMPNFYFHVVTAYSILRKNGVEVGKGDYLNNIPWHTQ